jgi:hypothetical protein
LICPEPDIIDCVCFLLFFFPQEGTFPLLSQNMKTVDLVFNFFLDFYLPLILFFFNFTFLINTYLKNSCGFPEKLSENCRVSTYQHPYPQHTQPHPHQHCVLVWYICYNLWNIHTSLSARFIAYSRAHSSHYTFCGFWKCHTQ